MKINEFAKFLPRAIERRRKVLAVGPPGVGKTLVFAQAAKQLEWDIITLCTPLLSPVKVGGYPRPPADPEGDATHCLFDGIARAMRSTKPTVLVFEDLGMGNGETLKSILEFVQFGRIDGRVLPEHVVIGATSNDIGHGADVMGMIEPLKSRWDTILHVETDVQALIQYGLAVGWPSDLCAYLRNSPQAVHDWKPSKSMTVDGASPRGWDHAAGWINAGFDDPEVLGGCVGKGRASEYLSFRQLRADLPEIDVIIDDPENAPVPENPSARYLVATAVSSRMSTKTFGQCLKYLDRMPQMFRAFSIHDAVLAEHYKVDQKLVDDKYQKIVGSKDFQKWAKTADGQAVLAAAQ